MILRSHHHKSIGHLLSENMIVCVFMLLSIGLFMVMDATAPKNVNQRTISLYVMKQLTWNSVGLICFFTIVFMIPKNFLKSTAFWAGMISFVLLAAVLVLGVEIKGARRWFRIGMVSFQPSELAKIGAILFFGWYLDKRKEAVSSWFGMLACMSLILLMVGLIAIEPDLGNAALLLAVLVGMLFIAGAKIKHLTSLLIVTLPLFGYFMYTKFGHVKRRIMVYLNPEDHLNDGFYQGHQALIALGSGGWSGKGIGEGLQKLYYLPEAHNDFIFAIIGEDLGFIGCATVVSIYALLVWYAIQVCFRSADLFSLLVAFGVTCLFAGQALFNISVVTGMVPNKGISLPLISYGGSNALFTLIGLGVLVKLTRDLPPDCPKDLGAIAETHPNAPLYSDMSQEELEQKLQHPKWQIRNIALKKIGAEVSERSKELLVEVIKDRCPSPWIKKLLGEPFHQVGFIRRNAWTALKNQELSKDEFFELLQIGLNDPYYEVRTVSWQALAHKLEKEGWNLTQELRNDLKVRVTKEKDFEIQIAMMPALEYVMNVDEILKLAEKVRAFKSWKVRGVYFDLLVALYEKKILTDEKLQPYLNTVHLRSDYFKPIFLLKEKRQNLDRLIGAPT